MKDKDHEQWADNQNKSEVLNKVLSHSHTQISHTTQQQPLRHF